MAAEPTIDYETLAQDAMRGVVRTVLKEAAKSGLPGEHHFYISFDTAASGVVLSKRLKDKYPHEMTIVLQHQFWDLEVGRDSFSVTLSFQKQLERLTVPFAAVRSFADPSVNFALEFASPEQPETAPSPVPAAKPTIVPAPITPPAMLPDRPAGTAADKAAEKPEKTGAEVVTLDSFRKR